jgi:hypothetical protein
MQKSLPVATACEPPIRRERLGKVWFQCDSEGRHSFFWKYRKEIREVAWMR